MASSTKVTYEDLEVVLNKYHIRTKTFFFKKSRKLVSVLTDLANKWAKLSPEDKYIINQYFMGDIYTHAMERYSCDCECDCDCDCDCDSLESIGISFFLFRYPIFK